ncbi:MAG: threonylcarbamoyl-AMP synthase [Methanobacterium sp.]|nr:threonylcarbamoyl-AMP synthase [Methanobacterium sp.]
MKLIQINPQNPEKEKIKQAINILKADGTVVYPTDTIYGLGASLFSEKAIEKVYNIKKRLINKPLSVCVSEISDIHKIAYLNKGEEIIEKILPGPYTIILKKREHISSLLTAGSDKIGVRIPNNKISRELCREFPITATSANISGRVVPGSLAEVVEQLGEDVDLIIDGGKAKGTHSTVIDWTTSPPKILRRGATDIKINLNF